MDEMHPGPEGASLSINVCWDVPVTGDGSKDGQPILFSVPRVFRR